MFGVLDRVTEQIDQYLPQLGGVGTDVLGNSSDSSSTKAELLLGGSNPHHVRDILHQNLQVAGRDFQHHPPGFDLGNIQHVID